MRKQEKKGKAYIAQKVDGNFNIYYLNFDKLYEMAMIIDNYVVKSFQREKSNSREQEYSAEVGVTVDGSGLLKSIKSSLASNASERITTNTKVVESIEVQTTKSVLLRKILRCCNPVNSFSDVEEGDLIKIDRYKLTLWDEESLRQFLLLKRDALKGLQVEGMDVNNVVGSLLQDYAYILLGQNDNSDERIIIKIPMEAKAEFESKYNIDDVLIGHVSIVGIYKGEVDAELIGANTFSYFQERGTSAIVESSDRIIKSNKRDYIEQNVKKEIAGKYKYVDVIAVIQDVSFRPVSQVKLKWWNRLGYRLATWGCNKNV